MPGEVLCEQRLCVELQFVPRQLGVHSHKMTFLPEYFFLSESVISSEAIYI